MSASFPRHAVIDVGSSTLKFAIYDRSPEGFLLVRESDPTPTSLGRGLVPGGPLDPEARRASLEALARMKDEIDAAEARLSLIVATEAVRQTGEREDFVAAMQEVLDTDTPVRVITGEVEARWALRSAEIGLGLTAPLISVDPGGSSTDCAWLSADGQSRALSLRLGMNPLMAAAAPEGDAGRLTPADVEAIRKVLTNGLRPLAAWDDLAAATLVGTSGAALALGTVSRGLPAGSREERARGAHGHRVSRAEIETWIREEAPRTAAERRERHPSLTPLRSQIFVHGALLWEALLAQTGQNELIVNGWGMKLGGLAETLES